MQRLLQSLDPDHLSAKVDKEYVKAKKNPEDIKYIHPIVKEITEETYGFLIFQEQIALLAHKLGKNISLLMREIFLGNFLTKERSRQSCSKED